MAVRSDRATWLQDYARHSKQTLQDIAAKQVFDALEKCEHLITQFDKTDEQSQALFVLKSSPAIELIRVVVRIAGTAKDQVFVALHHKTPKEVPLAQRVGDRLREAI
ncbi:MAG: hypothetical protein NT013_03110 [Planctomycetia bacterium]|nr:hypothetical protein [Planctomycetia bacterium]